VAKATHEQGAKLLANGPGRTEVQKLSGESRAWARSGAACEWARTNRSYKKMTFRAKFAPKSTQILKSMIHW